MKMNEKSMSAQHTPVLMSQSVNIIRDAEGMGAIADTPEIARRLAACWNACDGISTEHLEDDAVRKLIQDRDPLLAQRDELLQFARSVVRYAGSAGDDYLADKARAAIAKAIG